MIRIKFRKLLAKINTQSLLETLVKALETTIFVTDTQNQLLWGELNSTPWPQYPVMAHQVLIGWVHGGPKAQIIAQMLSYIADQEWEKKNLAGETLDKYEEINFLYDLSAKLSTSLTISNIIDVMIEETKKLLDVSQITLILKQQTGELEIFGDCERQFNLTQKTISFIAEQVLRSGQAEIINDVTTDSRYIQGQTQICSLICAPLKTYNETIGVIEVGHINPGHYTSEDLKLFTALTSQAAVAIQTAKLYEKLKDYSQTLEENVKERTLELEKANQQLQETNQKLKEANQKLEHLATVDDLTQVYNRRYFNEYLDREWRRLARERHSLSIILCDVDYFKLYNDHYHHQAGDECLRQIANTLKQVVKRPADLVARFGGEEFVIILSDTNELGAAQVAQQLCYEVEQLRIPHAHSQCSSYVTLSLGVATTIPTLEVNFEALIRAADNALYTAKARGKNCYALQAFRPQQF